AYVRHGVAGLPVGHRVVDGQVNDLAAHFRLRSPRDMTITCHLSYNLSIRQDVVICPNRVPAVSREGWTSGTAPRGEGRHASIWHRSSVAASRSTTPSAGSSRICVT